MKARRVFAGVVLNALFLGLPASGSPQEHDSREFGTKDDSVIAVSATAFEPYSSSYSYGYFSGDYKSGTSLNATFRAPLNLPSGALITRVELEACDESTTEQLTASLIACGPGPDGGCPASLQVVTGIAEALLCAWFSEPAVPPGIQVDNRNFSYFLELSDTGSSPTTRFRAVRVFWKRQVSPAPGIATFADVPTNHPFFKFVEALVASGITGGCAAGPPLQYCPDAPLTRGQMAVFLATALGLHWPN